MTKLPASFIKQKMSYQDKIGMLGTSEEAPLTIYSGEERVADNPLLSQNSVD